MRTCFILVAMIVCIIHFKANSDNITIIEEGTENGELPLAEHDTSSEPNRFFDFGIGLGYDYGGFFGISIAYAPIPELSFFSASGWMYKKLGWNSGVKVRLMSQDSKQKLRGILKVMYGVNGIIGWSGPGGHFADQVFFGLTPGIGLEIMFGMHKRNGIELDLNYTIHGSDFNNKLKEVNQPTPFPVAFSLGYHHEF